MSVKELVRNWDKTAHGPLTQVNYSVRLPLEDAAKIAALETMYPRRSKEQIITELLGAALHDLENSFPYEQGPGVISTDEMGDPIYEDVGPTPRFLELTRMHLARMKKEKEEA